MITEIQRDLRRYSPDGRVVAAWDKPATREVMGDVTLYGIDINQRSLKSKKSPPGNREINIIVGPKGEINVVFPTGHYDLDDAWSVPYEVAEHFLGKDGIFVAFQGIVRPNGSRNTRNVQIFQTCENAFMGRLSRLGEGATNPKKFLQDRFALKLMNALGANHLEVVQKQFAGHWII